MTKVLAKGLLVASVAATVGIGLAPGPALHTTTGACRWSAAWPAVSPVVHDASAGGTPGIRAAGLRGRRPTSPRAAYVAPAAPAGPTASSIEHQLNVLDDLAAKGYITRANTRPAARRC